MRPVFCVLEIIIRPQANPKIQITQSGIQGGEKGQAFPLQKSPLHQNGSLPIRAPEPQAQNSAPAQDAIDELLALYHQGHLQEALRKGEDLRARFPSSFLLHNILGATYTALSKWEEAVRCYTSAIQIKTDFAAAHNNLGNTLSYLKKFDEAFASYKTALTIKPDYLEAYLNLGGILTDLKRFDEAVATFKTALGLKPDYAEAHNNLGSVLKNQQRYEEAIAAFNAALQIKPRFPEAQYNLALILHDTHKYEQAVSAYSKALHLNPRHAEGFKNLGRVLYCLKRYDEALSAYAKALEIKPDYDEAYYNLGNLLFQLQRYEEAIVAFTKAIQTTPHYGQVYNNLAVVLCYLKRYEEALSPLKKALEINPDNAEAHNNIANIYCVLKRYDEAVAPFNKAIALNPQYTEAKAHRYHLLSHLCDWPFLKRLSKDISNLGLSGTSCPPFTVLSLEDSPLRHHQRSQMYASEKFSLIQTPQFKRPSSKPASLKIGYFSADFHNHATMHLMAGLFEKHNKKRFNLYAFSYGPDKNDEMRQRLKSSVHVFHDVRSLTDVQISEFARREGLDIAVDLKGYTQDSRVGIFSYRSAPIQITYLGYPGTTGSSFMDYIIADKTVIPPEAQKYYSEKVIYLPHCYQVNDDKRAISKKPLSRKDVGLPEHGFVFCCFNNNYKITEEEFDIWMRLLLKVDQSVLWLFQANPWAVKNLKVEAEKRGVHPSRLVFAEKQNFADHLARHRLADLFLDTFNYNAHTTASDALWAGLPLVTKIGEGFAARVGASLLTALQVPELISTTKEDYEAKALSLALQPEKLAAVKEKIEKNRTASPLFNTELFTRDLENAYEQAYETWFQGQPPHVIEGKATTTTLLKT
ncbi:MAG: tetratricopeptide repeat protein [Hyphomicrobium sp.]